MLKNDQLDQWDRDNFFHPSTHLAQHARGESPSRVIKTAFGQNCYLGSGRGIIQSSFGNARNDESHKNF